MPSDILLTPPVAFMIILAVTIVLAGALSRFSCKVKKPPQDMGKAYACGEEVSENRVQPD